MPRDKEKQYRAHAKFDKENTTRVTVKFNHHTDADLLVQLSKYESKAGYIKALIRRDIEMNRMLDDELFDDTEYDD